MKAQKLFACMMAAGLIIPTTVGSVLAADETKDTPVTYDNRNYIPDPENPDTPNWAVTIPSQINFTDDDKEIDASVELVSKNGGALPTGNVTVTVGSANDYKLKNGDDAVSYKLFYSDAVMTSGNKEVATLNNTATSQTGKAVLGNDKASTRGSYTDTLTYTISYTK